MSIVQDILQHFHEPIVTVLRCYKTAMNAAYVRFDFVVILKQQVCYLTLPHCMPGLHENTGITQVLAYDKPNHNCRSLRESSFIVLALPLSYDSLAKQTCFFVFIKINEA